MFVRFAAATLLASASLVSLSIAQETGSLEVGAARVDVSPTPEQLPALMTGIHDPLYARAIVVRSGGETAALIGVDAGSVSNELWQAVTDALETEHGISPDNVLISASHTHSAPRGDREGYAERIVQSVSDALADMQPAQMGFGTGVSHLNVNRNLIDPQTNRWWEGPNYDGVSDKTVAVVSFQTLEGEPIGVYYNYAMHAVLTGQLDMVSADYPGAASTYLEETMGDGTVAVFSSGAAGDQNPVFFNQTYELREIRIDEYASRGIDIANAMPPGGEGLVREDPKVKLLMDQQVQMSESFGQLLAEEVLHVTRNIKWWDEAPTISGAHMDATCPGRSRTDQGRAGFQGTYEDADDVSMRLGLLRLGDVYLGAVDGEVYNAIGQRFKNESPFKNTVMSTLTNGRANTGYIYSDAASGYLTFEVISSSLKPGCAESAIVNGLLDLVSQARN
ncbi:Neutral/alkaline non-lysosomal ceramidase, N-terminal [Devosia lucknowensis]|uniref:Neutral ceramidase n=1 Tax=Devosia lucknowensis TaxID=1096929 RepID=A0A1Y6G923_9HYPH|nr:neutral/alkaline non-lysosomal ceramidase N-terminal domain-containing protein [Devosia lucknowensis]SMQ85863.1 Neutral/alkaline non-lysosomal ceramidase, N-terminal [Devosia lucknowensis]